MQFFSANVCDNVDDISCKIHKMTTQVGECKKVFVIETLFTWPQLNKLGFSENKDIYTWTIYRKYNHNSSDCKYSLANILISANFFNVQIKCDFTLSNYFELKGN